MTCAADATIRLWDVEAKGRKTRQVKICSFIDSFIDGFIDIFIF